LRIISGSAKGLRLKSPHGRAIRPTSDRAREALFNIIGDRIREAFVLDLFAGTGALGIEALSRGANHVTFVDNSPESLNLIKRNLQLLQLPVFINQKSGIHTHGELPLSFRPPTLIIKCDLRKGGFYKKNERRNSPGCYNVIFLDPPYAKGLSLQALMSLDESNLLCDDGIVVAEDTPAADLPDTFNTLILMDKRRYGDTGFWFYKRHVNPSDG
jgi:16S rRNA (guanine966-N2)-methyltransferase